MADWFAMRGQVSISTARRFVSTAEALESLPLLDAAFGGGEVAFEQAALLCQLAVPETEAQWLRELPRWSVDALEVEARNRRVSPATRTRRRGASGCCASGPTPRDEGMRVVFGRLPIADSAVVEAAVADPDRATVVVHADADTLAGVDGGVAETEAGMPLSMQTAQRLACSCRTWRLVVVADQIGIARYKPVKTSMDGGFAPYTDW